ncbi:hypothetical protein K2X33_02175 [bacterium]|nr:hypothetical protein [bacterium]
MWRLILILSGVTGLLGPSTAWAAGDFTPDCPPIFGFFSSMRWFPDRPEHFRPSTPGMTPLQRMAIDDTDWGDIGIFVDETRAAGKWAQTGVVFTDESQSLHFARDPAETGPTDCVFPVRVSDRARAYSLIRGQVDFYVLAEDGVTVLHKERVKPGSIIAVPANQKHAIKAATGIRIRIQEERGSGSHTNLEKPGTPRRN